MKKHYFLIIVLIFAFTNISCSVYQTLVNIGRLKFKLGQVNGLSLNGVSVSNKTKFSDFNAQEILRISSAVAQGNLPVSFVLNVQAKNPNDGTGGYKRTNATLKSFPWHLVIDDKETISGNLASPVTVPGTGEITTIGLQVNLDLVKFFQDKSYQQIINLALAIGGNNGSSSKLTLYAKPTVTSSLGDITYPQELKIVNTEFSN